MNICILINRTQNKRNFMLVIYTDRGKCKIIGNFFYINGRVPPHRICKPADVFLT